MTDIAPPTADDNTETILQKLVEVVASAKAMPLSASVLVSRDEVLELLEEAIERLPEEVREARWMIKEREEFVAKTQRQANEVLEAARARAAQLVEKQEIVREAKAYSARMIDEARDESTRLRLEAEDYCDQKLGQFEVVLDRLVKTTQAGREKLAGTQQLRDEMLQPDDSSEVEAFFDQDISDDE